MGFGVIIEVLISTAKKKKNDIFYDSKNVAYWSSFKQNLGTLADNNINMTQIKCILQS